MAIQNGTAPCGPSGGDRLSDHVEDTLPHTLECGTLRFYRRGTLMPPITGPPKAPGHRVAVQQSASNPCTGSYDPL